MTVEFIGMIHHREASEIIAPPPVILDRGYIRDFAQAAETGGFDKVLVGYFSDGPDGFLLAAAPFADVAATGTGVACVAAWVGVAGGWAAPAGGLRHG